MAYAHYKGFGIYSKGYPITLDINEVSSYDEVMKEAQELATDIVKKLVRSGYKAYFAGGWVRDYVMKHPSDDIDIATSASPEVILDLYTRTILVGLSFGIVVVAVDGHQFEVATFRQDFDYKDGRKPERIEKATPEEDALRRDFTINGMFYDPLENLVIDYVGGLEDIEKKIIRTIGNPQDRFREDRLRMIRAVRFAARFGFHIDLETEEAIKENAETLFPAVAMERIWQEFCKMKAYPHFDQALIDLHRLELLGVIFPSLKDIKLNDLKKRVAPIGRFPKSIPTVCFLWILFPDATLDQLMEIGKYLKLSARDLGILEFLHKSKGLFDDEEKHSSSEWAKFYAHRDAEVCLQVHAAQLSLDHEEAFWNSHERRQTRLNEHIRRIRDKTPLVTAADLIKEGILPGKWMGELLREAETHSMLQDIHEPNQVIQYLMTTPLWQRGKSNGS